MSWNILHFFDPFLERFSNWFVSFVLGYFRPRVTFAKLFPEALEPTCLDDDSLGFDLYAPEKIVLHQGETKTIDTGIAFNFPSYLGMLIWGKSSAVVRMGLTVIGEVIDPGYGGPIGVTLKNGSSRIVVILKGSGIAQAVFHVAVHPRVVELESIQGDKGYGGDWEWHNKKTTTKYNDER